MATNPSTLPENAGAITAPDANYPYGSAKDDSTGTTGDGTPISKPLLNDTYGFYQWLLTNAGIVPSGTADTAINSDLGDALRVLFLDEEDKATQAETDAGTDDNKFITPLKLKTYSENLIADAPSDGTAYARQDAGWNNTPTFAGIVGRTTAAAAGEIGETISATGATGAGSLPNATLVPATATVTLSPGVWVVTIRAFLQIDGTSSTTSSTIFTRLTQDSAEVSGAYPFYLQLPMVTDTTDQLACGGSATFHRETTVSTVMGVEFFQSTGATRSILTEDTRIDATRIA